MTMTEDRAIERPTPTCTCDFTGDAKMHDKMLAFESLDPVEAARMVAEFILGESFVLMSSIGLGDGDPSDFRRFVMQHNWQDSVAMSELAEYVDPSAHRVSEHGRSLLRPT